MGLPPLRPLLILASGDQPASTLRSGTPKHLLRMLDGTPLYQRQLRLLRAVFPEPQIIYIALAPNSETDDYLETLLSAEPPDQTSENGVDLSNNNKKEPHVRFLRDMLLQPPNMTSRYSTGPPAAAVAGLLLLSAYRYDPWATWVVINCDYPLLPPDAIYHLIYKRDAVPVMCYRAADGEEDIEPLLALWGPPALARLAERAARGHPCPKEAATEFDALALDAPPGCEWWLTNVDSMEEEWVKTLEEWKLASLDPVAICP